MLHARAKQPNEPPEITLFPTVCEAEHWKNYQFENYQKIENSGIGSTIALKNLFFGNGSY